MAILSLAPSLRFWDLTFGSGRHQRSKAPWGRDLSLATANLGSGDLSCCTAVRLNSQRELLFPALDPASGKKGTIEKRWQDFFSDPSQWLDNRLEKGNARYPDFKHKKTQECLWVNDKFNPSWVEAELAAMSPGSVQPSLFSWNKKLANYVKAGQHKESMQLFEEMKSKGVIPNTYTFVPVLNACAGLGALEEGKRIHMQIIEGGFESDVYVGTCLVDMYAKCGSIDDAWKVFSKMPTHNVVNWTSMILGFVKCGLGQKALELYQQMHQEGVDPNRVTFLGLLNACASLAALEEGRHFHQQIIERGFENDVFVASTLINMYIKCGSMEDAWGVFNKMPTRNMVSWTCMIFGLVKCGQGQKALELSQRMQQQGVEPDTFTFVAVLNACASLGSLEEGRRAHEQIRSREWMPDIYVCNCLIDMFNKCGSIEDAWGVFDKMPMRNVVSWTTMIMGFLKCGQEKRALELSQQIPWARLEPDAGIFAVVLKACTSLEALEDGKRVHERIIQLGFESDLLVGSSLVDMYAKCGTMDDAWRVFSKIPKHNVIPWTSMILGLVKSRQGKKALELFQHMQEQGIEPDAFTFVGVLNACASQTSLEEGRRIHEQIIKRGWEYEVFISSSLVDMYGKCGSIEEAWRVFSKMPTQNVISSTAMIMGFVKCGQGEKALELFRQMQLEEMEPDLVTFVGVLKACASVGALGEGRQVHKKIILRHLEYDMGNNLIGMYSNCGSIEEARKVFDKMPTRSVVSWNAMLEGYAMHGCGKEALSFFEIMCQEGVDGDRATFFALLSACCYAGLVATGMELFESMSMVYGITPAVEHYACLVDLFGRGGHLQEAEDLVKKMPCASNSRVWLSLLRACRVHGNVEMGEHAAKQILELNPGKAVGYVLLSNIYTAAGRWEECANVQKKRLVMGVKKEPGRTWIEVNNAVHLFTVNDQEHPQIIAIRAELKTLSMKLKEAGYVPNVNFAFHDVDEETTFLFGHSEKLAIVFGLISTPPGTSIHIFKNQRVCSDCHTAIKFITKAVGREITVRDDNRFHCFKNGSCSCKDYW